MELYRCGWCGYPCDAEGNNLSNSNQTDYESELNTVGQVHGECCTTPQQEERMRVTRDMTIIEQAYEKLRNI
jgi:hypothetical protein